MSRRPVQLVLPWLAAAALVACAPPQIGDSVAAAPSPCAEGRAEYGFVSSVPDPAHGLFAVRCEGLWGYRDGTGREVVPVAFAEAELGTDGLVAVTEDRALLRGRLRRRVGYLDLGGRWAIPPAFDGGFAFEDGTARVRRGEEAGLIGTDGQTVIPFGRYAGLGPKTHGHMAAIGHHGLYGIVDEAGRERIAPTYAFLSLVGDGLAVAALSNPDRQGALPDFPALDRWGVVALNGEVIVPFEHDDVLVIHPIRAGHPWTPLAERTERDLLVIVGTQNEEGEIVASQIVGRGGEPVTAVWPDLGTWRAAGSPLADGAILSGQDAL